MDYTTISTSWQENREKLSAIRRKVFIEEQQVPEELEWDEFDEESFHILALDAQDNPIGTGRLKADGQIGRMAILQSWRNKSVGSAILNHILDHARQSGIHELYLHAQISAISFYEKYGFGVCSEEFMDAGIPHKTMRMKLD